MIFIFFGQAEIQLILYIALNILDNTWTELLASANLNPDKSIKI